MTRSQFEFPRDNRNQAQYTGDGPDLATINHRLRRLYDAHNNIPGNGDWLYVGKDVPFLSAWARHSNATAGNPRFRREGYDMVRIEGACEQVPFNAGNNVIWRMPDGFIPADTKVFIAFSANLNAARDDGEIRGYSAGASAGQVIWNGGVSTAWLYLDNISYCLSPSKY